MPHKGADGEPLDIQKAIERSTKRRALSELAAEGYQSVRVLDEKQVDELIRKAVDDVVHTSTTEQRNRILAEARKQLDKLLRQAKAFKGSADLLQTDKNELVARVENLQKQLELRQEINETTLRKQIAEPLELEIKEIYKRLKDSEARAAKLEETRDLEEKRAKEAEQGLEAYALLQERFQTGQQESRKLHSETIKLEKAKTRTEKEVEKLQADLNETRQAFEREKTKAHDLAQKAVSTYGQLEESQEELKKLRGETDHAHAESARLKKALAHDEEKHEAELKKARAESIHWKSDRQEIARLEALVTEERAKAADRSEAEKLEKQLARAQEESATLEKQLAHEKSSAKSLQSQLDGATAALARHRTSAKNNPATAALKQQIKDAAEGYEEKLAKVRDTARRLRTDADRAKLLESRLAREQAKGRKTREQLALPSRIDADLKRLQDRLQKTRESGLATRKLALQANEAVESVELLIDRLTKRIPRRR